MCDALNISGSGYYAYHKKGKSPRYRENQRLLVEIRIAFKNSRETQGSPRITAYLRVRGDLFSRKVVGWSTSSSLSQELAIKALPRAIQARKPRSGLIHHSDRGIQYASLDYQAILNDHGSCASIGGKENGYDSLS